MFVLPNNELNQTGVTFCSVHYFLLSVHEYFNEINSLRIHVILQSLRSLVALLSVRSNGFKLLQVFNLIFLLVTVVACERSPIPLLIPPDDSTNVEGVIRIDSLSDSSELILISAIDDMGNEIGSVELSIEAKGAVEITSTDLQDGNLNVGVSDGVGAIPNDVRLEITAGVRVVPMAFSRAPDGSMSPMHDVVRAEWKGSSDTYRYEIPFFYHTAAVDYDSKIRLINFGDSSALVTITGRDHSGIVASGGDVKIEIDARHALTLTTKELEAGHDTIEGRLESPTEGPWHLTISADKPVRVMNLSVGTNGHRNNLSSTVVQGFAPTNHAAFLERFAHQTITLQSEETRDGTLIVRPDGRYSDEEDALATESETDGSFRFGNIDRDSILLHIVDDGGTFIDLKLFFTEPTGGWFSAYAARESSPMEGLRWGGTWSAPTAGIEQYDVPLLIKPTVDSSVYGSLLISNTASESGPVQIYAISDAGVRTGPATFTLNANSTRSFSAMDLQAGDTELGLTGGIGTMIENSRLRIETDLQIVPMAFVRNGNSGLSAMHDTVARQPNDDAAQFQYEVRRFGPSTDATHSSQLRLINQGGLPAEVTISGTDDTGAAGPLGDVTLLIDVSHARNLTAAQLEFGDTEISGRLGSGDGFWQLTVVSTQALQVMNLVTHNSTSWYNHSTTAERGNAPVDVYELNQEFLDNIAVFRSLNDMTYVSSFSNARFEAHSDFDPASVVLGKYDYHPITRDASRLILHYEDGGMCRFNVRFNDRRSGWFASYCDERENEEGGTWRGGVWTLEDEVEQREDDHGDSRDTATVVAIPSETNANLTVNDVDFFSIEVSETRTLEIYTSGEVDTFGELQDYDGVVLQSDDDSGEGTNFLIEQEVSTGSYFVSVRGFDRTVTGEYSLNIR